MDTSEPTVLPPLLGAGEVKEKKKRSVLSKVIGSRCQVFRGNATHTSGRLTKDDLIKNQHGRIVSKKRHEQGKMAIKYLEKGGYKGVLPSKRVKKVGGSDLAEPSAVQILDK